MTQYSNTVFATNSSVIEMGGAERKKAKEEEFDNLVSRDIENLQRGMKKVH